VIARTRIALPVDRVIAAAEAGVVAVEVMRRFGGFGCIKSADTFTGAVTEGCRLVSVTVIVDREIITPGQVAETVAVISADCSAVVLGVPG